MKKVFYIIVLIISFGLFSCSSNGKNADGFVIKEYNGTGLKSIEYSSSTGGRFTISGYDTAKKMFIDFEELAVYETEYPNGNSYEGITSKCYEFTESRIQKCYDYLYSAGLFDIQEKYISNEMDGTYDYQHSTWNLIITFEDGTIKKSEGKNLVPDNNVFSNADKGFEYLYGGKFFYTGNYEPALYCIIYDENEKIVPEYFWGINLISAKTNCKNRIKDNDTLQFGKDNYEIDLNGKSNKMLIRRESSLYNNITIFKYNVDGTNEQSVYSSSIYMDVVIELELDTVYKIATKYDNDQMCEYAFYVKQKTSPF